MSQRWQFGCCWHQPEPNRDKYITQNTLHTYNVHCSSTLVKERIHNTIVSDSAELALSDSTCIYTSVASLVYWRRGAGTELENPSPRV